MTQKKAKDSEKKNKRLRKRAKDSEKGTKDSEKGEIEGRTKDSEKAHKRLRKRGQQQKHRSALRALKKIEQKVLVHCTSLFDNTFKNLYFISIHQK